MFVLDIQPDHGVTFQVSSEYNGRDILWHIDRIPCKNPSQIRIYRLSPIF